MARLRRSAGALVLATAAVFLSGAKPTPAPTSFTPALSYRYAKQEIRLANASGSQAALLLRLPITIHEHALAPLDQGRVAFVTFDSASEQIVRFVTWTQPSPGGSLSVTLDPDPILRAPPNSYINSMDFSPDGTRLAMVIGDGASGATQLRVFDVATKAQLTASPFAFNAYWVRWQSDGVGLWARSPAVFSVIREGSETALFNGNRSDFEAFNAGSSSVMLQGSLDGRPVLQRWDGGITADNPVVTTIAEGSQPTISCNNAKMIFLRGTSRSKVIMRDLLSGTEQTFSSDGNITWPIYPSTCH